MLPVDHMIRGGDEWSTTKLTQVEKSHVILWCSQVLLAPLDINNNIRMQDDAKGASFFDHSLKGCAKPNPVTWIGLIRSRWRPKRHLGT